MELLLFFCLRLLAMNTSDSIQFIQGRTENSINAVYLGYRYSRDGKPTSTHKQAWRCVLRTCKGRMHTVDGNLLSCTQEHNHSGDLADCEAKATLSSIKEIAASTRTPNHIIYAQTTGSLSQATRLRLPSAVACKKAAQRSRRKADPLPKAPGSLSEIELTVDDCLSMAGQSLLQFDNEDDALRIIVFGTADSIQSLERSKSWYIDGTFDSCPQHFYQLITIHAEFPSSSPQDDNTWCYPCLWILLTTKTEDGYLKMCDAINSLGSFSPDHMDYEIGLRNELARTYPNCDVDGCFFHFAQLRF